MKVLWFLKKRIDIDLHKGEPQVLNFFDVISHHVYATDYSTIKYNKQ